MLQGLSSPIPYSPLNQQTFPMTKYAMFLSFKTKSNSNRTAHRPFKICSVLTALAFPYSAAGGPSKLSHTEARDLKLSTLHKLSQWMCGVQAWVSQLPPTAAKYRKGCPAESWLLSTLQKDRLGVGHGQHSAHPYKCISDEMESDTR
jgi:hypothetical protein